MQNPRATTGNDRCAKFLVLKWRHEIYNVHRQVWVGIEHRYLPATKVGTATATELPTSENLLRANNYDLNHLVAIDRGKLV
jgi:hypothetical protein